MNRVLLDEGQFNIYCDPEWRSEIIPSGIEIECFDAEDGWIDMCIPTIKYPNTVKYTPTSVQWGDIFPPDDEEPEERDYTATIYIPTQWVGWEFVTATYHKEGHYMYICARRRLEEPARSEMAETLKRRTLTPFNSKTPELSRLVAAELFKKTMSEGRVCQIMGNGEHGMKDRLLQFFAYEHLPEHLQRVSMPFHHLARQIAETLPSNPERTVALRKLLEAKDCAVRALLFKEE